MPLEFNSLEEVPEAMRDEFTQHGDKFVPKDVARLIGETKQTLERYHQTKSEFEKTQNRLSDYEKGEAERIKAAQEAAEKKLREEGKFDELIRLEQEKAQNAELQYKARIEQSEKQFNELKQSVLKKDNMALARKIATQYAPASMVEPVAELLVSKRIKNVDDTPVFTNASGEAVALDDMGMVFQDLESDSYFKPFAAAPESRGGMGKGGTRNGDSSVMKRSAFDALPTHEKAKLSKKMVSGEFKLID